MLTSSAIDRALSASTSTTTSTTTITTATAHTGNESATRTSGYRSFDEYSLFIQQEYVTATTAGNGGGSGGSNGARVVNPATSGEMRRQHYRQVRATEVADATTPLPPAAVVTPAVATPAAATPAAATPATRSVRRPRRSDREVPITPREVTRESRRRERWHRRNDERIRTAWHGPLRRSPNVGSRGDSTARWNRPTYLPLLPPPPPPPPPGFFLARVEPPAGPVGSRIGRDIEIRPLSPERVRELRDAERLRRRRIGVPGESHQLNPAPTVMPGSAMFRDLPWAPFSFARRQSTPPPAFVERRAGADARHRDVDTPPLDTRRSLSNALATPTHAAQADADQSIATSRSRSLTEITVIRQSSGYLHSAMSTTLSNAPSDNTSSATVRGTWLSDANLIRPLFATLPSTSFLDTPPRSVISNTPSDTPTQTSASGFSGSYPRFFTLPPAVISSDTPPSVRFSDEPPTVMFSDTPRTVRFSDAPPSVITTTPTVMSLDTPPTVRFSDAPPSFITTTPTVMSLDTPPTVRFSDAPPSVITTTPTVMSLDTPPTVRFSDAPPSVITTTPTVMSLDNPPTVRFSDEPPMVMTTPPRLRSSITPPTVRSSITPPTLRSSITPPTVRFSDTPPTVRFADTPLTVRFSEDPPVFITTPSEARLSGIELEDAHEVCMPAIVQLVDREACAARSPGVAMDTGETSRSNGNNGSLPTTNRAQGSSSSQSVESDDIRVLNDMERGQKFRVGEPPNNGNCEQLAGATTNSTASGSGVITTEFDGNRSPASAQNGEELVIVRQGSATGLDNPTTPSTPATTTTARAAPATARAAPIPPNNPNRSSLATPRNPLPGIMRALRPPRLVPRGSAGVIPARVSLRATPARMRAITPLGLGFDIAPSSNPTPNPEPRIRERSRSPDVESETNDPKCKFTMPRKHRSFDP